MITDFMSLEIDLQENPAKLQSIVEAELNKYGKPLRWAITAVNSEKGKVVLEAVVTKGES